jgi:CheY-like chemotaxis protein
VSEASSGPDGLAMLATQTVDAVFTDLSMPGMDGFELAAVVREAYPATKIVLITGFGGTIDHDEARRFVDAVVSKPFLYSTLANVLGCLSEGGSR